MKKNFMVLFIKKSWRRVSLFEAQHPFPVRVSLVCADQHSRCFSTRPGRRKNPASHARSCAGCKGTGSVYGAGYTGFGSGKAYHLKINV